MGDPVRVMKLYRYPVKGLSPEPLERFTLSPYACVPGDRRFAIARASAPFDPAKPEWLSKTNFLMLMRDEQLAALCTRFDAASGVLTIVRDGRPLLAARMTEERGRADVARFFAEFMGASLDGPPRVVAAPGHAFSDARKKPNAVGYQYVSIINLASIRELEKVAGAAVDPIRFRANVYVDGAAAWTERGWLDREITLGAARLHVVSPIVRCAATTVNPETAKRDLDVPDIIKREFGHPHMGVYAEVVAGGEVARGDALVPPA